MSKAHVISAYEYDDWTRNWQDQKDNTNPYFFFKPDGRVQTGVIFPFSSLRYLFSTVGVVRIKVRFGLRKFADGRPPQFHLLLFGVDNTDTILTPYFTSSSFTHHHHYTKDSKGEGNLPAALMKRWKKSWYIKAMKDGVGRQMFAVNPQLPPPPPEKSNFLEGYSYSIAEMMQALGKFDGAANIHFKFGLHKYYSLLAASDAVLTHFYTFGLILYAATKVQGNPDKRLMAKEKAGAGDSGDGDTVIDDSGYYDFSAPCPFTC